MESESKLLKNQTGYNISKVIQINNKLKNF